MGSTAAAEDWWIRLKALAQLKGTVAQDQRDRFLETVRGALHDPFYLTEEMGEKLAAIFGLTECEPDIEAQARTAPIMMQRAAAQRALDELQESSLTANRPPRLR